MTLHLNAYNCTVSQLLHFSVFPLLPAIYLAMAIQMSEESVARISEKALPTIGTEKSIDEWRAVVRSLSGRTPKQVIARERILAIKDDILAARARGVSAAELAKALSDSTAGVSVRLIRELCAERSSADQPELA
ncbi:hypothetical protein [Magnetospirillum sp. SS-4]|uniref:hypothetical protein n=1 Tax=Magnetospirillum sp. SS-4 TaxID=2681465 RepID=UPI00137D7652|nr:hypothetical protein [Magnetospirillum sp. SS-4]CAA7627629.1 hypothetical protein MTBSS4_90154 [Magnetospirillum sp. SS-4]